MNEKAEEFLHQIVKFLECKKGRWMSLFRKAIVRGAWLVQCGSINMWNVAAIFIHTPPLFKLEEVVVHHSESTFETIFNGPKKVSFIYYIHKSKKH